MTTLLVCLLAVSIPATLIAAGSIHDRRKFRGLHCPACERFEDEAGNIVGQPLIYDWIAETHCLDCRSEAERAFARLDLMPPERAARN